MASLLGSSIRAIYTEGKQIINISILQMCYSRIMKQKSKVVQAASYKYKFSGSKKSTTKSSHPIPILHSHYLFRHSHCHSHLWLWQRSDPNNVQIQNIHITHWTQTSSMCHWSSSNNITLRHSHTSSESISINRIFPFCWHFLVHLP
jgi:hypothetical protein